MIWLDYFLQMFVSAVAWCLAVVATIGVVGLVVWLWFIWSPLPKRGRR